MVHVDVLRQGMELGREKMTLDNGNGGGPEELEDALLNVNIVKRRAEILEIRSQYRMDGSVYDSAYVVSQEIIRDNVTKDLIFSISQKVLGKRIHEETQWGQAVFFASWFQHLKATILPESILAYFPPKLRSKDFEIKYVWNICPHYKYEFDADIKHVEFVTYEQVKKTDSSD